LRKTDNMQAVCATPTSNARQGLYLPRNKIWPRSMRIRGLLYEEQTRRGRTLSLKHWDEVSDVAITAPICPTNARRRARSIRFSRDVSMAMRDVRGMARRRFAPAYGRRHDADETPAS